MFTSLFWDVFLFLRHYTVYKGIQFFLLSSNCFNFVSRPVMWQVYNLYFVLLPAVFLRFWSTERHILQPSTTYKHSRIEAQTRSERYWKCNVWYLNKIMLDIFLICILYLWNIQALIHDLVKRFIFKSQCNCHKLRATIILLQ